MKVNSIFWIVLILTIGTSCERNKDPDYPFEAEVLGLNMDCNEYQIRFISDVSKVVEKVGASPVSGVYIAENLPDDLKQDSIMIILDLRAPLTSELGGCYPMGPSLQWIHVIKAREK